MNSPTAATDPCTLSVIIPAYNEALRLGPTLTRIHTFLARSAYQPYEILVIDDGSHDSTVSVAEADCQASGCSRLLRNGLNRGKGYCLRRGVLAAQGRYVLVTDADLSTPIEELPRLIACLEAGDDVAIGSRALQDSRILVRQAWYRQSLGKSFNWLVQRLLLPGIHDTQCGFKCFTLAAGQDVASRATIDGFSFDVEWLLIARALRLRIREIPVTWVNSTVTHVRIPRDAWRMLCDIVWLCFVRRAGQARSQESRDVAMNRTAGSAPEPTHRRHRGHDRWRFAVRPRRHSTVGGQARARLGSRERSPRRASW